MSRTERTAYAPYNFSWVVPGKLACMGWPQNLENLRFLEDQGITHLITLSRERRPPLDDLPRSIEWTELPVEEFEAPDMKQVARFIDICQRAQFTKDVIGVHCRQGNGRTGVMAACYLVRFQDMTPEMAMIKLRLMRPGSVETYEQERIVIKYFDAYRGTKEEKRKKLAELPEEPLGLPAGLPTWKRPVHLSALYRYTNSGAPSKTVTTSMPRYVYDMRIDDGGSSL